MVFLTKEDDLKLKGMRSLYFYTSQMAFHQKMLFMIHKIEEKYRYLIFLAINVDAFKNQCKRFNIESAPTILILKDGKEVKRIVGIASTNFFTTNFDDICSLKPMEK